MRQSLAFGFTSAIALSLSGCGDHLGAYTIDDVRLVAALPQNDTLDWPPHPYPEFLRIELSSSFDLSGVNTGPGLYTDADFCPLRNSHRLIAFGPISNDETYVDGRSRRLEPDPRDGRYHYLVYVVPSSPPRKLYTNSKQQIPGYDLRKQKQEICLRFFIPGYNLVPSRSDVLRISSDRLTSSIELGVNPAARTPAGSGTR
jgi:hypothetical protein